MHTDRITYLLQQYLDDNLTPEEAEEWLRILQDDRTGLLQQALEHHLAREKGLQEYAPADWDPLFEKISAKTHAPVRRIKRQWLTAAAALALLTISTWLLVNSRRSGQQLATSSAATRVIRDIPPGGNKATLTLADNTTIDLDDAKEGVLGQQGDVQLIKQKDGRLSYQPAGAKTPATGITAATNIAAATAITYNLLTTPKGGEYQLSLPDGSKVWLNAASRLKYPTSFGGKERVVELQGEAYFEIARNPSMPFRVTLTGRAGAAPAGVEVLGTHFNVKAYPDDPAIQTTLLEGSVKVHKGQTSSLLLPGQAARWNDHTDLQVSPADAEEVMAWKNGLFKFNEATIEDVMRQLARWYDVEVVYVNGIPRDLFRGEIYRNVNVSKVLKVLEASGVHCTVEGKKILVKA